MNDIPGELRPVLWGEVGRPKLYTRPVRSSAKVSLPTREAQGSRLGERFSGLDRAFAEQATLSESLGASDPQLVIVFEAVDERVDLSAVATRAGLEVLSEVERSYDPDPNFPRTTVDKTLPVSGCLHAVCVNTKSKDNLLAEWRRWQQTGILSPGYAKLRDLFSHLKDVRPWGPSDRIRLDDLASALEGLLPGDHIVEIELWYRNSSAMRMKAREEVAFLIEQAGGEVVSVADIGAVGYLGMKCAIPLPVLKQLAAGDLNAVAAVKSSHVMYLRATAQAHSFAEELGAAMGAQSPLPAGAPVLCVLDGVPVANHSRLAERIVVVDPDDLGADSVSETGLRRHGTAMASICIWGDLSSNNQPLARPVLVRPILTPSPDTTSRAEELRSDELAPDLMRRVFRELFDGTSTAEPFGKSVVVLNLSVGDPAAPFDGVLSSWARTIDWLSAEYGVVVVVSAGNHHHLPTPDGAGAVAALSGSDRADAINALVAESSPRRSLLAPADSINALTVGALNADDGGPVQLGYRLDPADGHLIVNPTSALGGGYRRSVKPDLVAPGGRALFQTPAIAGATRLHSAPQHAVGPGIRVAGTSPMSETFTMGSSAAAALVSRTAARAADSVLEIADRELTRRELAVATKTFVAHSARIPDGLRVHQEVGPYSHGYGAPLRDLSDGCDANEASLLFVGSLGANESSDLLLPLPNGLQAAGVKRVTATLGWLSPVNWRHRQYRRAALEFSKPKGFTDLGASLEIAAEQSKRGTLQHAVWEVNRAVGVGVGDEMQLAVTCREQAGGLLGERVDFAVVLSLWVAPELGVDVYAQVRSQVVARVAVAAGAVS